MAVYFLMQRRQAWTQEENQLFLEGLQLYGQDWKQIEAHMGGTKTVLQIRKHAQTYNQRQLEEMEPATQNDLPFLGTKRKSDYQESGTAKKSRSNEQKAPWEHGERILYSPLTFIQWLGSKNFGSSTQFPLTQEVHDHQQMQLEKAKEFVRSAVHTLSHQPAPPTQGPNFCNIYSFLLSLLERDPTYLNKLHSMSAIDRETLQLLMHNLFINLANREFREQQNQMMQQYKEHAAQTLPDASFMPNFDPL